MTITHSQLAISDEVSEERIANCWIPFDVQQALQDLTNDLRVGPNKHRQIVRGWFNQPNLGSWVRH
jgi:hypothetical protein